MTPNAFNQGNDKEYLHRTNNEKKPKANQKITLIALLGLGLLTNPGYDATRPTITGTVIKGEFSNKEVSTLYIKNQETKSIDTLFLGTNGTLPGTKLGNFFGRADCY